MKNPRRVVDIALIVIAIVVIGLYNVSVGLRNQGKGLNGDKQANAAFAQQFAVKAETDCSKAGYPDPAA